MADGSSREGAQARGPALAHYGENYGGHEKAAEILKDVQSRIEKLAADGGKDVAPLVDPLFTKLERAHALLHAARPLDRGSAGNRNRNSFRAPSGRPPS